MAFVSMLDLSGNNWGLTLCIINCGFSSLPAQKAKQKQKNYKQHACIGFDFDAVAAKPCGIPKLLCLPHLRMASVVRIFYEAVTFTEEKNNKSLIRQPDGQRWEGVIVWDSNIDSLRDGEIEHLIKKLPASKQHLGASENCLTPQTRQGL